MKIAEFIEKYNLSYIDLIIKMKKQTITYIQQGIIELKSLKSFNRIKNKEIKKWEPLGPITYYIEIE